MSEQTIQLPTKKGGVLRRNPKSIILYAPPKTGKTTVISQLEDTLLVDLERGSEHVDAMRVQVGSLKELAALGKEIVKAGRPYKRIAIDTVSLLQDWTEEAATNYYKSTSIGKNFTGKTVTELPQGAGL